MAQAEVGMLATPEVAMLDLNLTPPEEHGDEMDLDAVDENGQDALQIDQDAGIFKEHQQFKFSKSSETCYSITIALS